MGPAASFGHAAETGCREQTSVAAKSSPKLSCCGECVVLRGKLREELDRSSGKRWQGCASPDPHAARCTPHATPFGCLPSSCLAERCTKARRHTRRKEVTEARGIAARHAKQIGLRSRRPPHGQPKGATTDIGGLPCCRKSLRKQMHGHPCVLAHDAASRHAAPTVQQACSGQRRRPQAPLYGLDAPTAVCQSSSRCVPKGLGCNGPLPTARCQREHCWQLPQLALPWHEVHDAAQGCVGMRYDRYEQQGKPEFKGVVTAANLRLAGLTGSAPRVARGDGQRKSTACLGRCRTTDAA